MAARGAEKNRRRKGVNAKEYASEKDRMILRQQIRRNQKGRPKTATNQSS